MLRSVLLLVLCALLARPSLGTIPGYQSEPGLLGKVLLARARARVLGEPVPPFPDGLGLGPKPKPIQSAPSPPNKDVQETEERTRDDDRRNTAEQFDQQEIVENNVNEIQINQPEQQNIFEDVIFEDDVFRQNSGRSKPNDRKEQFLKPGKYFPDGYPVRSDDGRTKSLQIFPTVPGSPAGQNMFRVLDSPLPKPGEMPSYTVFVRSGDPDTGDSPTVHIVKHSVQSVVPVDAKKDQKAILGMHMWAVPESLRNDESGNEFSQRLQQRAPLRKQMMRAENPDDVLGAAKRDLYFRMGSLYGVPRGHFGHAGAHGPDAFGHSHVDLIDDGYGGFGHGGLGHGNIGIGFGHGGFGHGGHGQGGYGHGGYGHGGFGHGGHGQGGYGHGGYGHGGYGHGGFGHGGFGHGGHGHRGFEEGAYGHGAFGDEGFGAGEHAQHAQDQDSFSHSTYSESTQGTSDHEGDSFGAGAHGHNKFGSMGYGKYGHGFNEFGGRSADAQAPQEGNPQDEVLGIVLPKQMMLPYMGLLDMSVGDRGYKHYPLQEVSVDPSPSGPIIGLVHPVYNQPPSHGPCVTGYC